MRDGLRFFYNVRFCITQFSYKTCRCATVSCQFLKSNKYIWVINIDSAKATDLLQLVVTGMQPRLLSVTPQHFLKKRLYATPTRPRKPRALLIHSSADRSMSNECGPNSANPPPPTNNDAALRRRWRQTLASTFPEGQKGSEVGRTNGGRVVSHRGRYDRKLPAFRGAAEVHLSGGLRVAGSSEIPRDPRNLCLLTRFLCKRNVVRRPVTPHNSKR